MLRRKLFLLITALMCAALALPAGVNAQRALPGGQAAKVVALAEAKDAAQYYTADSVLYVSMRIDDAYLGVLDSVLDKLISRLPQQAIPDVFRKGGVLRTRLVEALKNAGLDYQNDIRSWLGDRVSIGLGSVGALMAAQSNPVSAPVLVAVNITDKAKAEAFIDRFGAQVFEKSTNGDVTTYLSKLSSMPVTLEVRPDVLFIGTPASISAINTRDAKLNDSMDFVKTTGMLPVPGYNILAYVNLPEVMKIASAVATRGLSGEQAKMMADLLNATGPMAIGLTVLDDRSLTMDIAQVMSDPAVLEKIGLKMPTFTATKPDFAANLPDNAALYLQISNPKSYYDLMIAAMKMSAGMSGRENMQKQVEAMLAQVGEMIKAQLGLELESDILGWMTGDAAVFLGYDSPAPGEASMFTSAIEQIGQKENSVDFIGVDAGLVIEATDPAKAKVFVTKLGEVLSTRLANAPNVKIEQGENQVTINISDRGLKSPVQLVIAANDKVFVIATGNAAAKILGGADGLDKTEWFNEARAYFLPNAAQIWYFDTRFLSLVGDISAASTAISSSVMMGLRGTPVPGNQSELAKSQFLELQAVTRKLTSLIRSATITVSSDNQGGSLMRGVITLDK